MAMTAINLIIANDIFCLLLDLPQICVVNSVQQGSIIAEYDVSGTTYAPEGSIFDSNRLKVLYISNISIIELQNVGLLDSLLSLEEYM